MKELSKKSLGWLFGFTKGLAEALKSNRRFYPREDDIDKFKQLYKQLISQSERQVDGWYIKKKAREFYEAVIKVGSCAKNWIEHDEDRYIHEFKDIIRSIIQEINMPETKVSKEGKVKELDRDKLLEIVRIKLIGCQPCNGCELKNHCLLPQAYEQVKQIISQQETQVDKKYIEEKAKEFYKEVILKHESIKDFLRQFASEIQRPRITKEFPKIVCLCGSTRFTEQMLIKQWELTKQGFVVLSWCALPDVYFKGDDKHHIGDQEGVKEIVDELHLRKIDLANEVLILNVGGYIGESTQAELNYAKKKGKTIRFLEAGCEVEK